MSEFFKAVGERSRRLREERGLSLEELASLASLNRTYLWKAEQGRQNMSLQTLGRLAFALRVAPAELLAGIEVDDRVIETRPRVNARDPARRRAAEVRPQD